MADVGALDRSAMLCDPLATENDCVLWVAPFQLVSPAWLKSSSQVPAPRKLTIPVEMVHTEVAEESTAIATVSPEVEVAEGV